MYELNIPDFSKISSERREFLLEHAKEICSKYSLQKYLDLDYFPWEKLKYIDYPSELNSPEELYFIIQKLRAWSLTPVKTGKWKYFTINIPPFVQKLLHDLDSEWIEWYSGISLSQFEKKSLSQEWITEEAISSSQIEWAATSSQIARVLISKNKSPQNRDETMIMNNYKTMVYIRDDMKDLPLSEQLLLDLQKMITKDTLDDEWKAWRWREDKDKIVVMSKATWEVYHIPPSEKIMREEVKSLIDFANDKDDSFVHPFIKATILHFWISYLHPFCDWNWRSARAVFYRYLCKKWYNDFSYIPISRVIKSSKKQYENSFIYAEQENLDMTFFLVYIAKKTQQAFKEYREYILEKKENNQHLQDVFHKLHSKEFNERQIDLIWFFIDNPEKFTNMSDYVNQYNVTKNTAKADLQWLEDAKLLYTKRSWKYVNYYPTQKLLEQSK